MISFSLRRVARLFCSIVGIAALTPVPVLLLGQQKMIYHPRSYGSAYSVLARPPIQELGYRTAEGAQVSFYLPPKSGTPIPERLWILFGGNGSLALFWDDFLERHPKETDGFLLLEYPGYGRCDGTPSPESIQASAESALAALTAKLGAVPSRVGVLGHSLGSAAALNFASRTRVDRVVLIAPFTSLLDMARRTVGFPLCHLLLHRFDNRARLAELSQRKPVPAITIIHGEEDEIIPVSMGAELAALHPQMTRFLKIGDADHNTVLFDAQKEIHAAMTAP